MAAVSETALLTGVSAQHVYVRVGRWQYYVRLKQNPLRYCLLAHKGSRAQPRFNRLNAKDGLKAVYYTALLIGAQLVC